MAIDLTTARAADLAMALRPLHLATDPGERRQVRFSAMIEPDWRYDIALGAGFSVVRGGAATVTTLERFWTLPDTVARGMTTLIVGLNPSPASADAAVGFARPGNRFWPAALAADVVTRDRDPQHALVAHGLGMTDTVKRTTRTANELQPHEYADGIARLERLADRLQPGSFCFVGLAGWRAAIEKKARVGWQTQQIGGRPVYVMPSTSGLNASSQLDDFVEHFRIVKRGR